MEVQEAKIRASCTIQEVELSEVMHDEASGKDLNRPEAKRLIELMKAGKVGTVIMVKMDRLTRSVEDACALMKICRKKQIRLISLAETLDTSTSMGRFAMYLMAAFAEMERERIGERTKDALAHLRATGRRAGTVPYGYTAKEDGTLVEDPNEMQIIASIKASHDAGLTLRGIADSLNRSHLTTRTGGAWKFQYVANILKEKR